jgi:hypothetical protein
MSQEAYLSNLINEIHWLRPTRKHRQLKAQHAFLRGSGGNSMCSKAIASDTEIALSPSDYDSNMACKNCLKAVIRLKEELRGSPPNFGLWLSSVSPTASLQEIESVAMIYTYWQTAFGNPTAREMFLACYQIEVPDIYDIKEGVR